MGGISSVLRAQLKCGVVCSIFFMGGGFRWAEEKRCQHSPTSIPSGTLFFFSLMPVRREILAQHDQCLNNGRNWEILGRG